MSIPLDRLYNYIKDIAEGIYKDTVLIYRFYPHGSKKIEDLSSLQLLSYITIFTAPAMYCNDQEPLNYDLYKNHSNEDPEVQKILKKISFQFPRYNFRGEIFGMWDQALLLHSEKRSKEIIKYQKSQFIPIYYWSHAVIARDWFRYAEHVKQNKQIDKIFLIYNRAWSGTREYRLYFAELLIDLSLQDHCQTSINPIEPELGIHYELHTFKNPTWRPETVLENYFPISSAHSSYSADFDIEDYETTDIEVVLETLFDDERLHLTEKSLRPIACGQPFMLAGTQGSLEYLRSYGFKTFGSVWDEYYDCIENPQERLVYIAAVMRQIANWTPEEHANKMVEAQAIADYNRQHFFSQEFFNLIIGELITNLTDGFDLLEKTNTSKFYMDRREKFRSVPELYQLLQKRRTEEESDTVLKKAETYYMRNS
jgi:hypothetical protein